MAKSFRFPRWVEKTRTYSIHPVAFIDQPVATPHQPRYAQQLPPGGSQGGCAARVAKLATPTELKKFLAYSNQRTTPPQSDLSVPKCRQICQLPQRWSQGGFAAAGRQIGDPHNSISKSFAHAIIILSLITRKHHSCSKMASAVWMPSMAADMMPPA